LGRLSGLLYPATQHVLVDTQISGYQAYWFLFLFRRCHRFGLELLGVNTPFFVVLSHLFLLVFYIPCLFLCLPDGARFVCGFPSGGLTSRGSKNRINYGSDAAYISILLPAYFGFLFVLVHFLRLFRNALGIIEGNHYRHSLDGQARICPVCRKF
jgi:hypothetical protein